MAKLAIIGASYLQNPLILRAKEMGHETHVFAWAAGDVGEKTADYFYPLSITLKDEILAKCREIGIDGICTIASDLAAVTVNYVANEMGLVGNNPSCAVKSTNKNAMRKAFQEGGDPSPLSICVGSVSDLDGVKLDYPIIVKPLDRSGSRGITKLSSSEGLSEAIELAKELGFEKKALVEEFAEGHEYSVECISYKGKHTMLAVTLKYTTGAPHFIETGHIEPAPISDALKAKIQSVVYHALDSLEIANGASHSEIKIDSNENIKIIEIGGRMGGDFIGSSLVKLSTGIDFLSNVIEVALGKEPNLTPVAEGKACGVRFIFDKKDVEVFEEINSKNPLMIQSYEINPISDEEVTDSSSRFGYFLMAADNMEDITKYMPEVLL